MSFIDAIRHQTRVLLHGKAYTRELDEEIRFHLSLDEMQARHSGAANDEASFAARRRFGNVTFMREETRRMAGLAFIDGARQDARYALRTLRRAPVFAIVAALTLALGIGATTAIFSVVSGVLLRALPYRDADRLVTVFERRDDGGLRLPSFPTYRDWTTASASSSSAFAGMSYIRGAARMLRGEQGPERVGAGFVSPGFFALMGTAPLLGRTFDADEERAGGASVAVISHAFWLRRFGGDPAVIGRTLELSGQSATVIGVMPPGFAYPQWAQLWMPISTVEATDSALGRRGVHSDSRTIARLRSGTDSARAAAAMRVVQGQLATAYPAESSRWTSVELRPLRAEVIGTVGPTLWVLAAAVGLVLLLACANVANLSLVRASSRARELAVRAALGAGRWRMARQLLTESLVLATIGGLLGVALASAAVSIVRQHAGQQLPRTDEIALDWRVLLFALGASVLAALLAGVAPAIGATRPALIAKLRSGVLGSVGGRRDSRVRGALVSLQLALALVLLIGAGLLVQSVRRLEAVPIGFDTTGLVATSIDPPAGKYDQPAQAAALYRRLLARLQAVPGVESVALVNHVPLSGAWVPTRVEIDGRPADASAPDEALYRTVSESYLRTMRIPLVRGRWYSEADMTSPEGAGIVINETAAKRYWPTADPIGRRITVHRSSQARPDFGQPITTTVVGVIGDVRSVGQDADTQPEVFVPYTLEVWPWISVVVRAQGGARAIPALRRAVLEVEPSLPVSGDTYQGGFTTVDTMVAGWAAQRRFATSLLGAFAAAALLLAALGMYGVIAYGVSQRTREVGIRIALGATSRNVMRLIIGEAVWLAAIGIAAGVAGAFALSRLIRALLFQTAPTDAVTYIATVAVLTMVALLASWLPARRATRLDPTVAIRME